MRDIEIAGRGRQAFFAARDAAARNGADRDLYISHSRIGDAQVAQGNLIGALTSRQCRPTRTSRVRKNRRRAGGARRPRRRADLLPRQLRDHRPADEVGSRQHQLATPYLGVVQQNWRRDRWRRAISPGALESYQADLAIADRLATSDPGNAGWQRDLSVSYIKIGDVQVDQGDLAGALKSYRDSLAIRDRLTKSDPDNAGWQFDLGISNERIGDVQRAQGEASPGR